jgi:AraC-like DNA-binding protein
MSNQEHLALRLARLKSSEELVQKGEGLNFVFSKGGFGRYTSRSTTHRLGPGDILVFNGASGSKIEVFDKKGEFLFWVFSACFENLLPLFASNEISILRKITEGFEGGKVYSSNTPLAQECQKLLTVVPAQFNLDHRGQLIRIAASVLSKEFKDGFSKRSSNSQPEDHMVQVFEKLSSSELINLSVGELAERFSCSRRHLNRLFHQHFGASVATLRMEMRLLKAVSLLRDANIKVIHVAEQCGFNHLGLFNTCFKRRFGASPGKWRKLNTKGGVIGQMSKMETETELVLPAEVEVGEAEQPEVLSASVVVSCAGKITDGDAILEDLKRRDLLFGAQTMANTKRAASGLRRSE